MADSVAAHVIQDCGLSELFQWKELMDECVRDLERLYFQIIGGGRNFLARAEDIVVLPLSYLIVAAGNNNPGNPLVLLIKIYLEESVYYLIYHCIGIY